MIQVKITKNIMHKSTNTLGIPITPVQIIFAVIGIAAGILTFIGLKNSVNIDLLMWIIFIELAAIIGFGVVRINGMNLFAFIFSKKVDKRPFNRKGVFNDDQFIH